MRLNIVARRAKHLRPFLRDFRLPHAVRRRRIRLRENKNFASPANMLGVFKPSAQNNSISENQKS